MRLPRILILALLVASQPTLFGTTTFTFNLDGSYATSAGVFKPDGTLIRTLWRKVAYGPGPTTRTWDDRDDGGNLAPAGNYEIRVLFHNTQYVFDGMIGNSSSPSSGTGVFHGMTGMHNLAISGTSAFFANGLNEGRSTMHFFDITNPYQQMDVGHKDYLIGFDQVAADENTVYFGCRNSGFDPRWRDVVPGASGYYTFVTAFSTTLDLPTAVFPGITFPYGVALNTNRPPGNINPEDHSTYWPSAIDVDQDAWPSPSASPSPSPGSNYKAPTGIAVQRAGQGNGNVLAVAHGGLNLVRLFDKSTGALLTSISVPNPQGLAMAPDGGLWVISGATVRNYFGTPLNGQSGEGKDKEKETPVPGPIASFDLNHPVAIVVSPYNQLIVADGGTHNDIRYFFLDGTPSPLTFGVRGGYLTNGPDVAENKFEFHVNRGSKIDHTPLALQNDGTGILWIGDGATNRLMHYSNYLTPSITPDWRIYGYLGANGTVTVDAHQPKRVIGDGFLEFEANYDGYLFYGWNLKKNWAAGLPSRYFSDEGGFPGLRNMITFTAGQPFGLTTGNGRTYALLSDFVAGRREIVELPASGPLRLTGQYVLQRDRYPGFGGTDDTTLESDGSLRYHVIVGNTVTFREARLTGFDQNGNPSWEAVDQALGHAPATNLDPIAGAGDIAPPRHPKTSSNVLVSFDPSSENYILPPQSGGHRVDHLGWHLGGLKVVQPPNETDHWLWRVSPTILTDLDGLGSFLVEHAPDGTTRPYAGTAVMASGRNIVYGYHEEFYHNSGNASQWMHFYDDGLFVGQFGTPYDPTHEVSLSGAVPGSTALMYFPSMVEVDANNNEAAPGTGEIYIWTNTLSSHCGVPRWHIVGANQIQEMTGTVSLGGTININNPTPPTFPTGLKAFPGNGQVALSWTSAPPPATSYVLKLATTSFGPPGQSAAGTTGTSHTFTGLTNDSSSPSSSPRPYYIRISGGTSTVPNEVLSYPFDHLGRCGQLTGGPAYPWQVSSDGPLQGTPSLSGISSVVGNLALTSVGSKGYAIYGWQFKGGNRVDVINTTQGFNITLSPTGWTTWPDAAHFRFDIDGKEGSITAIHADNTGDVNIVVPPGDSSVHYLTVFCPALNDADEENHIFNLTLTSLTFPTTPPAIYSNSGLGKYNRIYQFEFIGNVKLTIARPQTSPRIGLQAIFLD